MIKEQEWRPKAERGPNYLATNLFVINIRLVDRFDCKRAKAVVALFLLCLY